MVVLDQGSNELRQVPFGTCIWTTGIRMHPLSEKLAEQLQAQEHWCGAALVLHMFFQSASRTQCGSIAFKYTSGGRAERFASGTGLIMFLYVCWSHCRG